MVAADRYKKSIRIRKREKRKMPWKRRQRAAAPDETKKRVNDHREQTGTTTLSPFSDGEHGDPWARQSRLQR
jgi:hypothetical protein